MISPRYDGYRRPASMHFLPFDGRASATEAPAVAGTYGQNEKAIVMNATWRQRSACRGLDPEVFFPVSEEDAEEAKAICSSCVVRHMCLEHALIHREQEGIWGGTTERERRRLLRQRRKTA